MSEKEDEKPKAIADLPNELLSAILGRLPRSELVTSMRVSHLWLDACIPLLYGTVTSKQPETRLLPLLDAAEDRLTRYTRQTRKGSFQLNTTALYGDGLKTWSQSPSFFMNRYLQAMTSVDSFMSDKDPVRQLPVPKFLEVFGGNLSELDLSCNPSRLPLYIIPLIGRFCPHLKTLSVGHWDVSFAALRLCESGLRSSLRKVVVYGCTISMQDLSDFLQSLEKLEHLVIRDSNIGEPVDALSLHLASQVITRHAPHLVSLELAGEPWGFVQNIPVPTSSRRLVIWTGLLKVIEKQCHGKALKSLRLGGAFEGYNQHLEEPRGMSEMLKDAWKVRAQFWEAMGEQLAEGSTDPDPSIFEKYPVF